jgi:hypothetical protein
MAAPADTTLTEFEGADVFGPGDRVEKAPEPTAGRRNRLPAARIFMKFRGPKALPNRRQKPIIRPAADPPRCSRSAE